MLGFAYHVPIAAPEGTELGLSLTFASFIFLLN